MAAAALVNKIVDATGGAVAGVTVRARLRPGPGWRGADQSEIVPEVDTVSAADGTWTLNLERNADITPPGTWYEIIEEIPPASGGTRSFAVSVGVAGGSLLGSLVTPSGSTGLLAYLTQGAADARYKAIAAPGDFLVVTSATRPLAPGNGTVIYETDTGNLLVWDGTAWHPPWGLPWGQLANAKITATQGGITGETNIAGLTATVTVPANRRLKVTAHVGNYSGGGADIYDWKILEGATVLADSAISSPGSGEASTVTALLTPAAGAHTYKVTSNHVTGATAGQVNASATQPAFLLVEDIGPAGAPA